MHAEIYTVILIAIMSIGTMLLRGLPLMIYSGKRQVPQVIMDLGDVLPNAMIGMLVVYCLKDINFTVFPFGICEIVAGLIVVAVQAWKRNSILSILTGTICYMVFLNLI